MYSLPAAMSLSRRPELLSSVHNLTTHYTTLHSKRRVRHSRKSVEDISVSGRVPVCFCALGFFRTRQEGLLVYSGIPRLLKSENVDVMVLVFLDDPCGIFVGVERVHQDERDVDVVFRVEVLNVSPNFHSSTQASSASRLGESLAHLDLSDGEIKESHIVSNFNDRLWTHTTHSRTQSTVQLEHGQLVQDGRVDVG